MKLDLAHMALEADWHERLPRYLLVSPLVKGRRVLDLGCGAGVGSVILSNAGAAEVVGLDPDGQRIELARRHLKGDDRALRFVQRDYASGLSAPTSDDEADEADEAERFDVVLALSSALPLSSGAFWEHIAEVLAPDGVVVVVGRSAGHCGFWDVAQVVYGGAPDFPTAASLRALMKEHIEGASGVLELAQESTLGVRFASSDEALEERRETLQLERREEPSNLRMIFWSAAEQPELKGLSVRLPQGMLLEQLLEGVLRQVRRLEGLEHQTVVMESQLSQKDHLVDDLESEVQEAVAARRAHEEQIEHLREELDRLQGELTQREVLEGEEVLAQVRGERDRLQRELEWHLSEANVALDERENMIEQLRAQLHQQEEHAEQLRAALDAQQHRVEVLLRQRKLREAAAERSALLSRQGVLPFSASESGSAVSPSVPNDPMVPWIGELEPVSIRAEDLLAEALRELAQVSRAWREVRSQLSELERRSMSLEQENTRLHRDVEDKQRATDRLYETLGEREAALKALGEELGEACYEASTRAELLQEALDAERSGQGEAQAQLTSMTAERDAALERAAELEAKLTSARESSADRQDALELAEQRLEAAERDKRDLVSQLAASKARGLALEQRLEAALAEQARGSDEPADEGAPSSDAAPAPSSPARAWSPLTSSGLVERRTQHPGPNDARAVDPVAASAALDDRLKRAQREIEAREARIAQLEKLVERWRTIAAESQEEPGFPPTPWEPEEGEEVIEVESPADVEAATAEALPVDEGDDAPEPADEAGDAEDPPAAPAEDDVDDVGASAPTDEDAADDDPSPEDGDADEASDVSAAPTDEDDEEESAAPTDDDGDEDSASADEVDDEDSSDEDADDDSDDQDASEESADDAGEGDHEAPESDDADAERPEDDSNEVSPAEEVDVPSDEENEDADDPVASDEEGASDDDDEADEVASIADEDDEDDEED